MKISRFLTVVLGSALLSHTSTLPLSSQPILVALAHLKAAETGSTFPTGTCACASLLQSLVVDLVVDQQCYSTPVGAHAFVSACAADVVYEDCFYQQPFVGKEAVTRYLLQRVQTAQPHSGKLRLDMLSDGTTAAGFAWTWTTTHEEGLRGTTFVSLNLQGKIEYVREIPEPLYKPGDATLELLKAITKGASPKIKPSYEPQKPTTASDVVGYLFNTVQGSCIQESMRFFDDAILYRDFNYQELLTGKQQVQQFIQDFSFPGIEFRTQRIDDGMNSCCFTWEVVIEGVQQTVKGVSLYQLDPDTRKIIYVRDIPESPFKPPPLGALARKLRPALGVWNGVPVGSRPGGR